MYLKTKMSYCEELYCGTILIGIDPSETLPQNEVPAVRMI